MNSLLPPKPTLNVRCSVVQCVAVLCSEYNQYELAPAAQADVERALQCGAECCSVLQCVAVCCSVLQCFAVCTFNTN